MSSTVPLWIWGLGLIVGFPLSTVVLGGWRSTMRFTTFAEIFITSRSWLAAIVTALGSPENRLISPKNSPLRSGRISTSSPVSLSMA